MSRESFDLELQRLEDAVLVLGSQVENAIVDSVNSLKERGAGAARHIIAQDRLVNERRFELEAEWTWSSPASKASDRDYRASEVELSFTDSCWSQRGFDVCGRSVLLPGTRSQTADQTSRSSGRLSAHTDRGGKVSFLQTPALAAGSR